MIKSARSFCGQLLRQKALERSGLYGEFSTSIPHGTGRQNAGSSSPATDILSAHSVYKHGLHQPPNILNSISCSRVVYNCHRFQHSSAVGKPPAKQGFFSRLLESTGLKAEPMRYRKPMLKLAGCNLYLCLTTFIDFDEFMKEFDLPDAMNSWFRVNELHVWMCMVRLKQEGADGQFMRGCFIEAMWEDMANRTKKLGDVSAAHRRKSISLVHTQFKAALLAYDEGLIGDDHVLAGALWRIFYEMDCKDVTKLEKLVAYVRRQMSFLDDQDSAMLLSTGLLPFLEINREKENMERREALFKDVMKSNVLNI